MYRSGRICSCNISATPIFATIPNFSLHSSLFRRVSSFISHTQILFTPPASEGISQMPRQRKHIGPRSQAVRTGNMWGLTESKSSLEDTEDSVPTLKLQRTSLFIATLWNTQKDPMLTVLAACIPFILRTHLIVEDTQSFTSLTMDYHRPYGWPEMALLTSMLPSRFSQQRPPKLATS